MNKSFSTKKIIIIEYLVVALIIASYLTDRYLCIISAVLGFVYILIDKSEHNSIALLLFVLPFSSVFNVADGTTSLYMFLRIACALKLVFKYKISIRYFVLLIAIIGYSLLSMFFGGTSGGIRIINLVLWFLIGLARVLFYDKNKIQLWARALAQGTILSCIIGLNLQMIPKLRTSVTVASYLSSDSGAIVSRFSGLWNDPNGLTVFIIVSMFICLVAFNSKHLNIIEFYIYEIMLTVFGLLTLSKSCMILLVLFWGYLFLFKSQMKFIHKIFVLFIGIIALYFISKFMSDTITELIARFTSASSSKTLTTGRTDLWMMYLDEMNFRIWLFGKGINADLPNGRAAHNTLIQIIYNIGIVGLVIWSGLFIEQNKLACYKNRGSKRLWIPIFALIVTMFFLDGMFLELFYILIPVLFCTSFSNRKHGDTVFDGDRDLEVTYKKGSSYF